MKYNPNNYSFLCMTSKGYVVANNVTGDLITTVFDGKPVGYMREFNDKCKYFTEVVELTSNDEYNIGEMISHKGKQWFVLEISEKQVENKDSSGYNVLVGL